MRSLPFKILNSALSITYSVSLLLFLCLFILIRPATTSADETVPPARAQLIDTSSDKYQILFTELTTKHGFQEVELNNIFSGLQKDMQVIDLMDNQQTTIPLLSYVSLLFTPAIVDAGRQKLIAHKTLLDTIEDTFGVDREFIIAIWAIETRFGQNQGKFKVFQSLNTLFDAYPRRSSFFRKELIHFLLLCKENNLPAQTVMGSYAGAFGQAQFMPSSFREYSVSFDGNDTVDIFNSVPDILASIANYLRRHHWMLDAPLYADLGNTLHSKTLSNMQKQGRKGRISRDQIATLQRIDLPEQPDDKPLSIIHFEITPLPGSPKHFLAIYPNFRALTAWNHSNRYAMAVTHLARAIAR